MICGTLFRLKLMLLVVNLPNGPESHQPLVWPKLAQPAGSSPPNCRLAPDTSLNVTRHSTTVAVDLTHSLVTRFERCVLMSASTNVASAVSVPGAVPVYEKVATPLALVVPVPVVPLCGPSITLKVTGLPASGTPSWVTVAVSVWLVPTGLVADPGASLMSLMTVTPRARM